MRGALLLLVLLLRRGGATDEASVATSAVATSKGNQSSDTLTLTSSPTSIITEALSSSDISQGTLVPTTSTPLGTSAPLLTTSKPLSVTSNPVADPKKDTSTPPSSGTLPSTRTTSHTDASTMAPASTLTSPELSPPTTTADPTTTVTEVVSSTAPKSTDSLASTSPGSTFTAVNGVISSSVATTSSVPTPAADITSTSTGTTTIIIPSSPSALSDTSSRGPASPSGKPETSTTHPGVNVGNDHTAHSTSQAPGTTMESTTKLKKPTAEIPGQSGVPHTSSSISTAVNFFKISSSTHYYTSVPTATTVYPPNQIICVDKNPDDTLAIILTLNESSPCDGEPDVPLHEMLCKVVKPTFNRSRDTCTVRRAAARHPPNRIAVLGITVLTYARSEELFEMLVAKQGELQKAGISNVTYAGRHMEDDNEDRLSMPLIITIVCMACALLLVAAIYGCCHQRVAHRKDQQRLTEELQTMENGYHDNPTLEVMETSSEMQEKKVNLNGELGDSWIVPLDTLMKEEPEEEDTHL